MKCQKCGADYYSKGITANTFCKSCRMKPCLATDPKELRSEIMGESIPKTEREWWAKRHIEDLEKSIIDCWDTLYPYKHRQKYPGQTPNEEIIENQSNLLDKLNETLEPVVKEIQNEED